MATRLIYACGLIIAVAMVAVAGVDPRTSPVWFFACLSSASGAYLVAVRLLPRADLESRAPLVLCLALAAVWRLPLLMAPPVLSTDIYRYVWDGRLQHHGYDPYTVVPNDPAVKSLHDQETEALNHPALPTPYPPVAELFFRAATYGHESVRTLKTALELCDVLIVVVLLRWLASFGRGRSLVLAYAWNPLVALEVAGNGHVDLLGALFLLCSAWCLANRRRTLATLAWALAIGVKFLPIVLAPIFWRRVRPRDLAVGAVLLLALYAPFLAHGRLPMGSLGTYLDYWRFNAPLFAAAEAVAPGRVVMALAVAISMSVAGRLRKFAPPNAPAAWAWPIAAALLVAPAVYPWYLLWLTPFLTGAATWPLAVWTVSVLITYLDVISGLPRWGIAVEYGLVLAASLAGCPSDAKSIQSTAEGSP
jgi:hypothetical protein